MTHFSLLYVPFIRQMSAVLLSELTCPGTLPVLTSSVKQSQQNPAEWGGGKGRVLTFTSQGVQPNNQ